MDRQRLNTLIELAATVLSDQTTRVAESKLQLLPVTLRPWARAMVDPSQIRSTISAALTRLDELSDDEWRSLAEWIVAELAATGLTGDQALPSAVLNDAARGYRNAASSAIAHVTRLMTE